MLSNQIISSIKILSYVPEQQYPEGFGNANVTEVWYRSALGVAKNQE
jgi:hypothetical protein